MRRFSSILILLATLAFLPAAPAAAWFFGNDTLVTIDGASYSSEDFKRWWQFWKEEGQPLPPTPDPYVDFLLLAREGERMELDSTPDFQRQTRVYLTARTLLMYKYDAVDSQIKLSDADIRAHYEAEYQPRWLVQHMEFLNEGAAKAAWESLVAKTVTVDQLLTRPVAEGGPVRHNENWVRPSGIDPGWMAIFREMAVGDVVDPAKHEGGPTLYHLKEQKGGDDEDFAKLAKEVERDLWKQREDELTYALLQQLREKYQVNIDQERIDALDINAADDTFSEDIFVIKTTRQNVNEKQFMAVVRKLMGSRPGAAHAASDSEAAKKLKNETVSNILAQSLTNWGALDQHYEEKEPFKWEYQFNRQHRMTLELESLLFAPEAKVSDEEIKAYYDANLERYSQPEMVKVFILDDTQGPIEQIWADVVVGENFAKAVQAHLEKTISAQEVPANHLDPDVKIAVDKLAIGETSPIFTAQGSRVITHLVSRTPSTPFSLERVAPMIRSQLVRDKVDQVRKDYLDQIKSRSQIEVSQRRWRAIQKELGGV